MHNINRSRPHSLSSIAASALNAAALALSLAVVSAPAVAQPAASAPATSATEAASAAPALPAITPVPAPSAPAASAAVSTDNPYGLQALWSGSDWIARAVLIILLIMSLGTWYIMIVKVLSQAKMNRQSKSVGEGFWNAGSLKQGVDTLDDGSPYRFIAQAGVEASKKHGGLLEHVDLNEWVTMSIQRAMERVQSRMQDGLAFLATVGSTAPFIGLFGTVWGIYHALTAIGASGQASIDKVAGPVGEALIMTAIGLAVAVPAVLGYNWLVRRNKGVMDDVRAFGSDLHQVILSSARKA